MRLQMLAITYAALMLAVGGCAHDRQTRAVGVGTGSTVASNSTVAPPSPSTYVPAGTEFTVILTDEIGSASSIPGQRFTGQLEHPLRAADGSVFAPAGATVRGTVARVDYATRPSLRLDFETVETASGPAVLETSVRDVAGLARVARSDPRETPPGAPDTVLYPPTPGTTPRAIGGGPPSPIAEQPAGSPSSVLLPRGTPVRLVLKHHLLSADFSAQYGE